MQFIQNAFQVVFIYKIPLRITCCDPYLNTPFTCIKYLLIEYREWTIINYILINFLKKNPNAIKIQTMFLKIEHSGIYIDFNKVLKKLKYFRSVLVQF